MVGRQLGEYVIEALLGAGGMAKVYKARHTVLDTVHAIKVLDPEYRESAEVRRRFLDEGKIQAKHLLHPNIVRVTNVLATPDAAALVMDYVDGGSLETLLEKRRRRFTRDELLAIAIPILDAMSLAHANGIIHRDLKPANVLLRRTATGAEPVIADFGIAKIKDPGDAKQSTHHETRMGTLGYSSPEQIQRAKDVTARSDIFSLGAMFYELLAGDAPFGGDSEFAIMTNIVQGRFAALDGRVDPSVPPHVIAAVHKALASDPLQRFETCKELAAALTQRSETAVAAPPAHNRMVVVLGVAGAVLAAGVFTTFLVMRGRSSDADPEPRPQPTVVAEPSRPVDPPTPPPAQAVPEPPKAAELPTPVEPPKVTGPPKSAGRPKVAASPVPRPPRKAAPAPSAAPFEPARCDEPLCMYSPRYKGTACCAKLAKAAAAAGGGCDEISCMLQTFAGACCAKFKKPASAPSTGAFRPAFESPPPKDLDAGAFSAGVARVKGRIIPCFASLTDGRAVLQVNVRPDGRVNSVTVRSTPDQAAGECAAKAMAGAQFSKTQNGGSFSYPIVF